MRSLLLILLLFSSLNKDFPVIRNEVKDNHVNFIYQSEIHKKNGIYEVTNTLINKSKEELSIKWDAAKMIYGNKNPLGTEILKKTRRIFSPYRHPNTPIFYDASYSRQAQAECYIDEATDQKLISLTDKLNTNILFLNDDEKKLEINLTSQLYTKFNKSTLEIEMSENVGFIMNRIDAENLNIGKTDWKQTKLENLEIKKDKNLFNKLHKYLNSPNENDLVYIKNTNKSISNLNFSFNGNNFKIKNIPFIAMISNSEEYIGFTTKCYVAN
ncbi:hypothetical protein [Flavobacterium marginilacus]|uniref:hypothetical protein n=1 Tax=Flavobacterium marginilacus TaxID=3003256 RepID=UPI00248DA1A4|nr:hypothetical protein [Flavobacterium marginilacus]